MNKLYHLFYLIVLIVLTFINIHLRYKCSEKPILKDTAKVIKDTVVHYNNSTNNMSKKISVYISPQDCNSCYDLLLNQLNLVSRVIAINKLELNIISYNSQVVKPFIDYLKWNYKIRYPILIDSLGYYKTVSNMHTPFVVMYDNYGQISAIKSITVENKKEVFLFFDRVIEENKNR